MSSLNVFTMSFHAYTFSVPIVSGPLACLCKNESVLIILLGFGVPTSPLRVLIAWSTFAHYCAFAVTTVMGASDAPIIKTKLDSVVDD